MNIPDLLINEYFDDRYFDVVDALYEASKIYIEGNNILVRLEEWNNAQKPFCIGETGFGTGRTLLSLLYMLDTVTNIYPPIMYQSVELFPISASRMESILSMFKDRAESQIAEIVAGYKTLNPSKTGWQNFTLFRKSGTISVRLFFGEALDMVNNLEHGCDAWFLDGHGPKKNPLMWRKELLLAVSQKTNLNGTVGTFTVAGDVRRTLIEGGFTMERYPGFGGKKMAMRGVKGAKAHTLLK